LLGGASFSWQPAEKSQREKKQTARDLSFCQSATNVR
jgi:hypothetical protein